MRQGMYVVRWPFKDGTHSELMFCNYFVRSGAGEWSSMQRPYGVLQDTPSEFYGPIDPERVVEHLNDVRVEEPDWAARLAELQDDLTPWN